jgi:uncharacterized membrane protein
MLAQLALLLLAAPTAQSQPPTFRCVVLDTPHFGFHCALAINQAGESAGVVPDVVSANSAARWDSAGNMTNLGNLSGFSESGAYGISEDGLVVGYSYHHTYQIGTAWPPVGAGYQLPVHRPAWAVSVNALGDILLWKTGSAVYQSGVLLERDGTEHRIDFGGNGWVMGLTRDGQVAGMRTLAGTTHAFRWNLSTSLFDDLPPLPGFDRSSGYGIAPDGTVTGFSGTADFALTQACAWGLDNVPKILPPSRPNMTLSIAISGNAAGWIIGQEGFPAAERGALWLGGIGYELTPLVVEGPTVVVTRAAALNDAGQIVGSGMVSGTLRAIRLDPL